MKKSPIQWISKKVKTSLIKPTPNNYKIKTDLGLERLNQSLNKYGLAGTVVINTDYFLIDGNSRLEQAKKRNEKEIWVSLPNRKLTPKEFSEMSAMYDFAKAGEVDLDRIKTELGSSKDFYDAWGLEVPMVLLDKLGAKQPIDRNLQHPADRKAGAADIEAAPSQDIKMVQLFFNLKQEEQFRALEELFQPILKVDNTTDCVMAVFKLLAKNLKLKDKSNGKAKNKSKR